MSLWRSIRRLTFLCIGRNPMSGVRSLIIPIFSIMGHLQRLYPLAETTEARLRLVTSSSTALRPTRSCYTGLWRRKGRGYFHAPRRHVERWEQHVAGRDLEQYQLRRKGGFHDSPARHDGRTHSLQQRHLVHRRPLRPPRCRPLGIHPQTEVHRVIQPRMCWEESTWITHQ